MTDRITHRTRNSNVTVYLNGAELLQLRAHAIGGYVTPKASMWGGNVAQFRTLKQALGTIRTRVRNFRSWGIDPARIYSDLTSAERKNIPNR
jgi:hypothetical protein